VHVTNHNNFLFFLQVFRITLRSLSKSDYFPGHNFRYKWYVWVSFRKRNLEVWTSFPHPSTLTRREVLLRVKYSQTSQTFSIKIPVSSESKFVRNKIIWQRFVKRKKHFSLESVHMAQETTGTMCKHVYLKEFIFCRMKEICKSSRISKTLFTRRQQFKLRRLTISMGNTFLILTKCAYNISDRSEMLFRRYV